MFGEIGGRTSDVELLQRVIAIQQFLGILSLLRSRFFPLLYLHLLVEWLPGLSQCESLAGPRAQSGAYVRVIHAAGPGDPNLVLGAQAVLDGELKGGQPEAPRNEWTDGVTSIGYPRE